MFKGIFEPKLLTVLREGYTKKQFSADVTAGIVVGIVAIPLAIAFAIASGVKPEQGLYTAIAAGIIVSVLGGSRVQIAGPTGAFIVIVYEIVGKYGYEGLVISTIMAGVILILIGLAKFGSLLKFIPYPLTVGFTSAIALVIFSTQVPDLLGLKVSSMPPEFIAKWQVIVSNLTGIDAVTLATGVSSLLLILLTQKLFPKIPGSLLAIVLVTAAVHFLKLPVETIGMRFGDVPGNLPSPHAPELTWNSVTSLISPAITIAILCSIESLLSAVVADGMLGTRHRPNTELIAQGIANVVSPLFFGIPATGAIARTATNIKNGGRTPFAGILHGIFILLIMIFFGKLASLIPMPVLSAILIVVAYNMSEWRSFIRILRYPKSDIAVMLTTFFLTILVDLSLAIQAGVILSSLLFIKRMADVSQVTSLTGGLKDEPDENDASLPSQKIPEDVRIFEIFGSLFFGAVEQFTETIRLIEKAPKVLILETKNLMAIDATGIRAMEDLYSQMQKQGTVLLISGIHKQPLFALSNAGLIEKIGEDNVFGGLKEAIERSVEIVSS